MRVFEIYNAAKRNRTPCAHLFYDGAKDEYRIDVAETAKPEDLPVMLGLLVEQGVRSLPDKWARRWVAERVPPQGRQNLGEVLRANNLEAYDELALLAVAGGRSAQDDFLLRELSDPECEYALVRLEEDGTTGEETVGLGADSSPARTWCEVVGPEIARRRKKAGLTQCDLAEKTGIDQAAISRIEAGRANPTINTLDALAKGVGSDLLVKIV